MSTTAPERHIDLETCFNFRDLGGYRTVDGRTVRWRHLYRADGIYRLSEADLDIVNALGVATVIDLRTVDEVNERGRFTPGTEGPANWHHLPVFDVMPDWSVFDDEPDAGFVVRRYREMLVSGNEQFAEALRIVADPRSQPAVFHCAAGKDRTGILAALVLSLLGVPDGDVVADYALSTTAIARMIEWVTATDPEGAARWGQSVPPIMLTADPPTMEALLAGLRSDFGSIEAFVESLGVARATIDSLRESLLT
jgi:protein-tyrosine phosphatase